MLVDGLQIKSFETLQEETEELLKSKLGEDLNLSSESPLGQVSASYNLTAADIYELVAEVLNQTNPDTATGIFLQRLAALTGTLKKPGRKTIIESVELFGKMGFLGQTAPPGEIRIRYGSHTFINKSSFKADIFSLGLPLDAIINKSFDLIIENKPCHFPLSENRDLKYFSGIFQNFMTSESIYPPALPVDIRSENNSLVLCLKSDRIPSVKFSSQDGEVQDLEALEAWGQVVFTGTEHEPVNIPDGAGLEPAGKIPQGMTGARNPQGCVPGESPEADQDLRIRQKKELKKEYTSSVSGIRRTLLNIPGVRSAIINEPDPAHDYIPVGHIEIIVQGGDNQKLAEAILKSKGAGILTWAPESGTDPDPCTYTVHLSGQDYQVKFQRPDELMIHTNIVIYLSEISDDINTRAHEMLMNGLNHYFSTLNTGDDIRVWKLERLINIPDLQGLNIRVKTSNDSQWSDRGVGVRSGQIAVLDAQNISVTTEVYSDVL